MIDIHELIGAITAAASRCSIKLPVLAENNPLLLETIEYAKKISTLIAPKDKPNVIAFAYFTLFKLYNKTHSVGVGVAVADSFFEKINRLVNSVNGAKIDNQREYHLKFPFVYPFGVAVLLTRDKHAIQKLFSYENMTKRIWYLGLYVVKEYPTPTAAVYLTNDISLCDLAWAVSESWNKKFSYFDFEYFILLCWRLNSTDRNSFQIMFGWMVTAFLYNKKEFISNILAPYILNAAKLIYDGFYDKTVSKPKLPDTAIVPAFHLSAVLLACLPRNYLKTKTLLMESEAKAANSDEIISHREPNTDLHKTVALKWFMEDCLLTMSPNDFDERFRSFISEEILVTLREKMAYFIISSELVDAILSEANPALHFSFCLWVAKFAPHALNAVTAKFNVALVNTTFDTSVIFTNAYQENSERLRPYFLMLLVHQSKNVYNPYNVYNTYYDSATHIRKILFTTPVPFDLCKADLVALLPKHPTKWRLGTLFKPAARQSDTQEIAEKNAQKWWDEQACLAYFADQIDFRLESAETLLQIQFQKEPRAIIYALYNALCAKPVAVPVAAAASEAASTAPAPQSAAAAAASATAASSPVAETKAVTTRRQPSQAESIASDRRRIMIEFFINNILNRFTKYDDLAAHVGITVELVNDFIEIIVPLLLNPKVSTYLKVNVNSMLLIRLAEWLMQIKESISNKEMTMSIKSGLLQLINYIYKVKCNMDGLSPVNAFEVIRPFHEYLTEGLTWEEIQANIGNSYPYYRTYLDTNVETAQKEQTRVETRLRDFQIKQREPTADGEGNAPLKEYSPKHSLTRRM